MVANHVPNPSDGKYGPRFLTRKRVVMWNEPAYTVLTSPRDISIHPGTNVERMENVKPTLDSLPKLKENGLTTVELFAGGGLMRLGLEHAGLRCIWANDFDKRAVRAHQYNFGDDSIVHGDITQIDIDDIPDSDIISGGPPCQDYSIAGSGAGESGIKGRLVWRYLEIIERKQPKAFLFENVKGLITKKHRHTFDALLEKFDAIGYTVSWKLVNAWDYGVAQKRERVFIVGIRKDLGFEYVFPTSEYEKTDYHPVLRDAIGDLPEPTNGKPNHDPKELSDRAMEYLERDPRHLQKHKPATMDAPSATLPAVLHKGVRYGLMYPDNHDGHLFDNVDLSWNYDKSNREYSWEKPSATIGTKHRCEGIHPNHVGGISTKEYGQRPQGVGRHPLNTIENPSYTIMSGVEGGKNAIQTETRPRRFTVRECLRIQSVPDSYVFPDDMSLSGMYLVIGNGVASRVAYHLGNALAEQLLGASSIHDAIEQVATTIENHDVEHRNLIATRPLFDVDEYKTDAFPTDKYTVIYADPPWTYKDKASAGNRGVEFKYPTMTIDDIKSLPVANIAADDAVLFLWVTWPLLVEGIDTLRAWGFKYKTVGFVWIKLNRKFYDTFLKWLKKITFITPERFDELLERLTFFGMGNWTHANSEVCLMGVRGKPKRIDKSVRSVILAPIREHSQKPDEVRERIERLMGDVPRVELFARTRTPGWTVFGNDVDRYTREESDE